MCSHDTLLSQDIATGVLTPHHHLHLDPLVRLPAQQLTQGPIIDLLVLSSEQLQLSPDRPSCDTDNVPGVDNAVVQVFPARVHWGRGTMRSLDHLEVRQVLGNLSVLVQSHIAASVHAEVTVQLVALPNLNH